MTIDATTVRFSTFPAHVLQGSDAGPLIWTFSHAVFINEVSAFIVMVHSSVSAGAQMDAVTTVIGLPYRPLSAAFSTSPSRLRSFAFCLQLYPPTQPQLVKEGTNSVTK